MWKIEAVSYLYTPVTKLLLKFIFKFSKLYKFIIKHYFTFFLCVLMPLNITGSEKSYDEEEEEKEKDASDNMKKLKGKYSTYYKI